MTGTGRPEPPLRFLARVVLVAAAYYCVAKLGLSLGSLPGNVAPVWPPTGLALAALMIFGLRLWPAVTLGALLVNGLSAVPLAAAFGMATGNTLEALLGAYLLRRLAHGRSLERVGDVVALAVLGAGAATVVSATFGVASLYLGGVVSADAVWGTWRVWWVGDALGNLVVAPVLLILARGQVRVGSWRRTVEFLVGFAALVGVTDFALQDRFSYPYLIFPFVVWAAVRFSQMGAVSATLVVSIVAIARTTQGVGPFVQSSAADALWTLDTFLAVVAATGLVLAAVVTERAHAEVALGDANSGLDARVQERTADLTEERMALAEAQRVAGLGSWEWDIIADEVSWSEELYRLYGLDPAGFEASYEGFVARVHPEDRPMVEAAVAAAYTTGKPFDFEHRLVWPDGTVRWVHGSGQVVTDASGTPVRMRGTAQDITNRRQAETKFEALLEAAPDAIVVVDAQGIIRLINRQTEAMFGYERAELLGQPLETLLPQRMRDHHPGLRQGYFADPRVRPMGAGVELAACRRDGTEFPVDISLSPLETEAGVLVSAAIRDATDRKQAEAALAHQALHDGLTDLPNRTLLQDRLSLALARSQRSGAAVAVMFLDIDRFKVINDSRGHTAGDQLLQEIAARLRATIRPADTVARFGGDEFVIVTETNPLSDSVTGLSQRIATALRTPVRVDDTDLVVTLSMGVAVAGPDDNAESLLRDADAAMYQAKDQGRDRCVVFDATMRTQANRRLDSEHALRRAIDRDELSVYYQPIVELTSSQVVGVEALARWHDPERGLIMPDEFIPVAEETGLIGALGATVLHQACRDAATWQHRRPNASPLSVSVNLSARQLLAPGLPNIVGDALAASGLDAGLLCLEITESVFLDDAVSSAQALMALKALGVRIGVDDFGTGYSSLGYLKRFPVDTLKIDKSFVDGLGDTDYKRGDHAIVASVIDLAHALGLTTVAEGVETQEQLDHLRALGCEQAQGYLLSRPLPASETAAWINASEATRNTHTRTASALCSTNTKRLLLIDDDRSQRVVLRSLIDDHEGLDIVGEAADGREAVALARHHQPDLVLLDLAMPGMGGLEALPLIRAVSPNTTVVVLSGLDPSDIADKARGKGAVACFAKAGDPTLLLDYLDRLPTPALT